MPSDEIEIELTDHVGVGVDGRSVDHGQWIVRADGQQIGYLSKVPDSWLSCIVSIDDHVQQEIMRKVQQKIGHEIRGVASLPPVQDQEILDGDEDEEVDEWD